MRKLKMKLKWLWLQIALLNPVLNEEYTKAECKRCFYMKHGADEAHEGRIIN